MITSRVNSTPSSHYIKSWRLETKFGKFLRFGIAGLTLALSTTSGLAQTTTPTEGLSDLQRLGKSLFEDTRLSEPQGQSCASCHRPGHAFQGNNGSPVAAVALGSRPDQLGTRKVPSLMYKSFSPPFGFYKEVEDGKEKISAKGGQFWDGRASTLAEQATGPMLNPAEMNNPSLDAVVAKVRSGPYADQATRLFGAEVMADAALAMPKLADAIAAYESSAVFQPFSSRFDDWLRGTAKLTAEEKRGYSLFMDKKKGNCVACHAGNPESHDPTDWIFTDFTYDTLGVPRNPAIPANADPAVFDLGLCKRPGLAAMLPKEITLDSLCGAFKVPSLRNVAVTGPYFHNGAITTLRDAVAIYATRDTNPKRWYPLTAKGKVDKVNDLPTAYRGNLNVEEVPYDRKPGQRPRLSERDIDDLVAFLKTLTDKGMD